MTTHEFLQVFVTIDDRERANSICKEVVEKRLAACAQVLGPIQSIYWWQGKVEDSQEWLCLMKTSSDRYDELEIPVISLHPYDTPEVIALPIEKGSERYLKWLGEELKD